VASASAEACRTTRALRTTALAGYGTVERHFADSMAVDDRMGVPFWSAQRIGLARMLGVRGAGANHLRAAELAREAQQTAADHGFTELERQATELADAAI
jgi:hypothetical protein